MEKITLNGERYISLGEFNHIRRNMVKDIYDRYEKDENGQMHLSERDIGAVTVLSHIMTEIMIEEIHSAESPDEIRKMHGDLDVEFAVHRWVIVGKDDGNKVYFRKLCECAPKEDGQESEEVPVFASMARFAKTFHDYYKAHVMLDALERELGENNLELQIVPAWAELLPPGEAEKRLLKAIFKDGDENDAE